MLKNNTGYEQNLGGNYPIDFHIFYLYILHIISTVIMLYNLISVVKHLLRLFYFSRRSVFYRIMCVKWKL